MPLEQPGVTRWLELIQAEYREMPRLSLNKVQMQRLWGLDASICDALVDALVAACVLRQTTKGSYVSHAIADCPPAENSPGLTRNPRTGV